MAIAVTGVSAGCGSGERVDPVTRSDAVLLTRHGLAVEYVGALDRYTWFGPAGGPNLLHVEGLQRAPKEGEEYTFFGGCYTWVGPQGRWAGPEGGVRQWPPDPAMDVGPGILVGRGRDWFETRTPRSRLGLREVKRFAIAGPDRALLSFGLENLSTEPVEVSSWVNTAVGRGSVVAVRYREGVTQVWGWNDEAVTRFMSILEPVQGTGWAIVNLARADWEGGGKVWLDSPSEIAVWTDGWWLHRRVMDEVDSGRLREMGEGPVAMYIQPAGDGGQWIVEAELYGPVVELERLESATTVEQWRVRSAGPRDVHALD